MSFVAVLSRMTHGRLEASYPRLGARSRLPPYPSWPRVTRNKHPGGGKSTQRQHQFKRNVYAWSGGAHEQAIEEPGRRVEGGVHRDRCDHAEAREVGAIRQEEVL